MVLGYGGHLEGSTRVDINILLEVFIKRETHFSILEEIFTVFLTTLCNSLECKARFHMILMVH